MAFQPALTHPPVSTCLVGWRDSPALVRLVGEMGQIASMAIAPSTWRQYARHVQYFVLFLDVFGLREHFLAPPEAVLCLYATYLARSCAYTTVQTYLKGLKHFYAGAQVEVQWDAFTGLGRVLKGLKRAKGGGGLGKLPVTPPLLVQFMRVVPAGGKWACVFVGCVLGVFGLLRRSNLAPGGESLLGQAKHIRRADVFD